MGGRPCARVWRGGGAAQVTEREWREGGRGEGGGREGGRGRERDLGNVLAGMLRSWGGSGRDTGVKKFTPVFHLACHKRPKKEFKSYPKVNPNLTPFATIGPGRPARLDEIRGRASLPFACQIFKIFLCIAKKYQFARCGFASVCTVSSVCVYCRGSWLTRSFWFPR